MNAHENDGSGAFERSEQNEECVSQTVDGRDNAHINNDVHPPDGISPLNEFVEEKPSRLEENTAPSAVTGLDDIEPSITVQNQHLEGSITESKDKHTSESNQDDLRSRSSVYSSTGSHSDDSNESESYESDSYDSASSYERQRSANARQTVFSQQAIFNRFSNWRKQAATTLQQTANSVSVSSVVTKRTTGNSVPLQNAALSPAVTPTNDNIHLMTSTNNDVSFTTPTAGQGIDLPAVDHDDQAKSLNDPTGVIDNIAVVPSSSTDPWTDPSPAENLKASGRNLGFGSTSQNLRPQIDVLSRAAATVVDSMQSSYFRGRYTANSSDAHQPSTSNKSLGIFDSTTSLRARSNSTASGSTTNTNPTTLSSNQNSQTAKIMASPYAVHMHEIVQSLEPYEVVMLLGRGRLGVNLKQTYKKNTGVFVDFLVEGGAAHSAAVASVGDILKKIGNDDTIINGTILSVPAQIAKASRPVQLIFKSGTTDPSNISKINYIDISVALMHELLQQSQDIEQLADEGLAALGESGTTAYVFPSFDTIDSLTYPVSPSNVLQKAYAAASGNRNMVSIGHSNNSSEDPIVKEICQLAANNPKTFRQSLKAAFILCCTDCRRVPYLKNELSGNSIPFVSPDVYSYANILRERKDNNVTDEFRLAYMMLQLFLELQDFAEYFDITPVNRRHAIALRIAQKYILPTTVIVDGTTTLTPPPMDLHTVLVADSELRKLEGVLLKRKDREYNAIPRELFWDFHKSCFEQLSCGTAFAKFMTSAECSRMRAYLRNTAPFINVPLARVVKEIRDRRSLSNRHALNYVQYCILFLVTMTDKEVYGENDDLLEQNMKQNANGSPIKGSNSASNSGKPTTSDRIEEVANGICAAFFIQHRLLPGAWKAKQVLDETLVEENDKNILMDVIKLFEHLWEVFVAPNVGALAAAAASSPNEEEILEKILRCRSVLQEVVCVSKEKSSGEVEPVECLRTICNLLVKDFVLNACSELADELLYDYAINLHSKFRMHKFHEWLCDEALIAKHYKVRKPDSEVDPLEPTIPDLPHGCIKRLLRKVDLPVGLSAHKPSLEVIRSCGATSDKDCEENAMLYQTTAECAVVFGTSTRPDFSAPTCSGLNSNHGDIRRYSCDSVALIENDLNEKRSSLLQPLDLPATLESYTMVSRTSDKPFGKCFSSSNVSADGWKISLINYAVPRAESKSSSANDASDGSLYGVSLIFQKHTEYELQETAETWIPTELLSSTPTSDNESDTGVGQTIRKVVVAKPCPIFNSKLREEQWSKQVATNDKTTPTLIGITLVSQRNVILSMRNALTSFLYDVSDRVTSVDGIDKRLCQPLVDLLGNFSHSEIESYALKSILEPHLRRASIPWIARPISTQKSEFAQFSGEQLIRSLPPIPLALMFVTALLEQKIVISSSRRSMLLSACTALTELLQPLKWCHVIVPQVPASLAGDLLQYPAPSILGLCSEDQGTVELIRNLSHDVTLVDLDVGRVILASSFAHDSELGRGTPNNADTARALRSQVLLLAQSLGTVFASHLDPCSWCCDVPPRNSQPEDDAIANDKKFQKLRTLCGDFINELLAGTTSCCYWIEEALSEEYISNAAKDPTVLFDEDRFFHIKNFRERYGGFKPLFQDFFAQECHTTLALSLDNFDLVLELFLRCQSMNTYIGSRGRDQMFFSIQ